MMETRLLATGIHMHTADLGPEEGPLVVLLHGFPEFWWGWRHQIEPLVQAGCRVIVPDQRGYNLSGKPENLAAYGLDQLCLDVVSLIKSAGKEKAILIGHDWGGIVAWAVAVCYPQMVDRLVVINAPYPRLPVRDVLSHPLQFIRSWYIFFFQLPGLAEWLLSRKNWQPLAESLLRSSRPGTFSEEDLARYRAAWSQPGAITCMLNWYRAYLRRPAALPDPPRVYPPTLVLWGVRDPALGKPLAEASVRLCADGRLIFHPEATHWIQHEEPDWVNHHILQFLREGA
jgi:pimeloyl-ACP methyl ester carboxylesterase